MTRPTPTEPPADAAGAADPAAGGPGVADDRAHLTEEPVVAELEDPADSPPPERSAAASGLLYGLGSYTWWGLVVPVYFRLLASAPALELLAHRVLWGLPFLFILITIRRRWLEYRAVFRSKPQLTLLVGTTVLIAANWFGFIYAVVTDRLSHAALGYYINPLVSIALAWIFLGERLRRAQYVAVAIAAAAIAYLTIASGGLPWISLVLAFSFGFYGLLRKRAHTEAMVGLAVEMTLLLPLLTALWVGLAVRGETLFASAEAAWWVHPLIALGGVVTVVPLLWFTTAARRLRLSTIGFLQYIAPTGQLLVGVAFGELIPPERWLAFGLIWAALAIFSFDSVRAHRASRRAAREAEPA